MTFPRVTSLRLSRRLNNIRILLCVLLVACGGVSKFAASFQVCYSCVWMHNSSDYQLESTRIKSDDCRPQNFDPHTATIEKCQYDCLTMTLYDYIKGPENDARSAEKCPQEKLGRRASIECEFESRKDNLLMTFYFRGCSRDPVLKPFPDCEKHLVPLNQTVYNSEVKCYCPTLLCNGLSTKQAKSSASQMGFSKFSSLNILSLSLLWSAIYQGIL